MKTHIIISIAGIENEINANREYLNSLQRNERSNDSDKLEQKTEFLEYLLISYKQISLDEKDIEKKAAITMTGRYDLKDANNQIGAGGFISGYKQALKDLI